MWHWRGRRRLEDLQVDPDGKAVPGLPRARQANLQFLVVIVAWRTFGRLAAARQAGLLTGVVIVALWALRGNWDADQLASLVVAGIVAFRAWRGLLVAGVGQAGLPAGVVIVAWRAFRSLIAAGDGQAGLPAGVVIVAFRASRCLVAAGDGQAGLPLLFVVVAIRALRRLVPAGDGQAGLPLLVVVVTGRASVSRDIYALSLVGVVVLTWRTIGHVIAGDAGFLPGVVVVSFGAIRVVAIARHAGFLAGVVVIPDRAVRVVIPVGWFTAAQRLIICVSWRAALITQPRLVGQVGETIEAVRRAIAGDTSLGAGIEIVSWRAGAIVARIGQAAITRGCSKRRGTILVAAGDGQAGLLAGVVVVTIRTFLIVAGFTGSRGCGEGESLRAIRFLAVARYTGQQVGVVIITLGAFWSLITARDGDAGLPLFVVVETGWALVAGRYRLAGAGGGVEVVAFRTLGLGRFAGLWGCGEGVSLQAVGGLVAARHAGLLCSIEVVTLRAVRGLVAAGDGQAGLPFGIVVVALGALWVLVAAREGVIFALVGLAIIEVSRRAVRAWDGFATGVGWANLGAIRPTDGNLGPGV